MNNKKKGLSREQAAELYKDLQRTMAKMLKNEAEYYASKGLTPPTENKKNINKVISKPTSNNFMRNISASRQNKGATAAILVIAIFAFTKVVLSALEYSGIATASPAEAGYITSSKMPQLANQQFSKEEIQILTTLDSRRSELEDRSKRLDEREQDIAKKDREFATRITELRELTEKLHNERDKNDKKQNVQLDQLANVYGSMNPEESAHLMEQLDITIALSLIERMPEKRIGQILALTNPERALALTKMLSGKGK